MRSWKRFIVIALTVVLVVAVGLYIYLFELGGLERIVIARIDRAVGEASPLTVEIGNIRGDLVSGVILEDVAVRYRDSLVEFQMLSVARIMASYSLSNLWEKEYLFKMIRVDSLDFVLAKDGRGRWLLPLPLSGKSADSTPPPIVAIDELALSHARIRVVVADDTLTFSDLDLVASLRGEERTYSAEIKYLNFTSPPAPAEATTLGGKATLSGSNLVFQDVQIIRGDTRGKLSGAVNVEELSGAVELAVDNLDLAQVSAITGGKLSGELDLNGDVAFSRTGLTSQVSLAGDLLFMDLDNLFVDFEFADQKLVLDTLYGTILSNCGIDGRGEIDFSVPVETYYLNSSVRNFDLSQLIEGSFCSDLTGYMELSGSSFRNADLLLVIDVDLHESSFDDYPLQRARGTIEITTDSLRFPTQFRVDYFENCFYATGSVDYDDSLQLEIEVDLRNLDRYRGKLFIDQPGGRGQGRATLSGRTADPDLRGWLSSDSLWLYGLYADSCYGSFSIDRFLTGRQGWVEIDVLHGKAWQIPYDTGRSVIRLDSNLVWIDSVSFTSQYATLLSSGVLDQGVYPQQLIIDTLALSVLERDFHNRSKLAVEIDSAGFDFVKASIGKEPATLTADGRVNYDESMDLRLVVSELPVASWLHLLDQELPMDGYLSCDAHLGGSFARPVMDLRGSVDSMTYRDLVLGDLSASVTYGDRLLMVDSLMVQSYPGEYRATGSFNIDLAFTADEIKRVPDLPFDLTVTATDERFDLVTLFLPSVEHLKGEFLADFRLSGTPSDPHLNGEAYLKNGELKYFDLVDILKTDSAGITMEDNRIMVDEIEVYVYDRRRGRSSYATVEGVLTVKSLDSLHYDLEISLPKEFPFKYELDDIEGVVEGDLHVYGDTPPTIEGDLTVISTRYRAEFGTGEEGSPLMLALSGEETWDLNLNIDLFSNYWIKNQDIDAEFLGFLNLIREKGRYRFIGELEILRGKGFLFDKTFRIEPGGRVTYEDIEHPNPRLDIIARTRVPVVQFQEEEERGQVETLCIHIQGTLEKPTFSTCEGDTLFSNEDILPLIFANYYGSETASAGRFEERVSQLISSQVSQIGTRRLGVETFEIDPTYEGQLDLSKTRVTLGVYTTPNLYLYGRSAVSFDRGQEVGFEYRFSKAFLFEGRRDEDELHHLDLKLHWEF